MNVKKFKYEKKNGEKGDYNLIVLNDGNEYISGIDLNKLSEEDQGKVKDIVEEFEGKLKPFMKAYRKFIVENIINEKKEE